MAVESQKVFRIARSYREQIRRNPKAVIVLVNDEQNEIIGIGRVNELFVGDKYEASLHAGLLERVEAPPVQQAPAVVVAVATTVAVAVEVTEAVPEADDSGDFESKIYEDDLEQPSKEIADALSRLSNERTIEPDEASAKEATSDPNGDESEPHPSIDQEIESPTMAPADANGDKPIRRRRVSRG